MKVSNPRFNDILYNRFVLYFVVFVSLVNLYMFAIGDRPVYAVIFILVGFLTSFFSKNMIVILVVAIAVSNLISIGTSAQRGMEGFREGAESKDDSKDESKDESKDKPKDDDAEKPTESVKKEIVRDGMQLLGLQEKIVDGFNEIKPYMDQAEVLAEKIQENATTIDKLKKM